MKEKKKKKKEWQRGGLIRGNERKKEEEEFGLVNGLDDFQLIYKTTVKQCNFFFFFEKSLNNATWKLKTGLDEFLKYMF